MSLDTYDFTKLSAYNICPTWGVLRYQMHKQMPSTSRALPLEMGTALHEVFALVRLETLHMHLAGDVSLRMADAMRDFHGARLFGEQRWSIINEAIPGEHPVDALKVKAVRVLDTSGYYDDDRDRRRTLSNMEDAAWAYIDRWDFTKRVWMRDANDPHSDVGIEIPFDLVVTPTVAVAASTATPLRENGYAMPLFRFTGKLDGLRWHGARLVVEDNKTTGRITDAWCQGWEISHQITGYCLAASVFIGDAVRNAEVIGLQVPLPRELYDGVQRVPLTRHQHHFDQWTKWAMHTVRGYERYRDQPMETPQYTHSCSRYFRPCSFIPFCDSDPQEQESIIEQMEDNEWSPLHHVGDTDA